MTYTDAQGTFLIRIIALHSSSNSITPAHTGRLPWHIDYLQLVQSHEGLYKECTSHQSEWKCAHYVIEGDRQIMQKNHFVMVCQDQSPLGVMQAQANSTGRTFLLSHVQDQQMFNITFNHEIWQITFKRDPSPTHNPHIMFMVGPSWSCIQPAQSAPTYFSLKLLSLLPVPWDRPSCGSECC
jgi:hypothetical protein